MKRELLRLCIDVAQRESPTLDAAQLAGMCSAVQMNAIEQLTPAERWRLLEAGLMSPYPAHFFEALRVCMGLKRLLPEVDALFDVPQLSDGPELVDVGLHQLRVVNETAVARAPIAVRFAALVHKVGKGGTPREIWPSHYKHELRAQALLDGLALRIAVPDDALALARLVVDEADRIHRASDMRAGPIAAMLDRLQCLAQPERFEQLLSVCACDYAAYAGHSAADYPKAPRLRRALVAYAAADVAGLGTEEALHRRAEAIERTLRGGASIA